MKQFFIFSIAAIAIFAATPAQADGQVFEPFQQEGMCRDMTGNWVMCDSMGGDGISADGGYAGGITNCTASEYCVSCGAAISGSDISCIRKSENAECNCSISYEFDIESGAYKKYCTQSGACTYRRN